MDDRIASPIFELPALIADDDDFFRIALGSVLRQRLGFRSVVVTASFDEAIERLSEEETVGLALFDLNMPGMDNWENLRTVRTSFPQTRVAVVSASNSRSDILMALRLGLHGYVHKGQGVSEMEKALNMICQGHIYVPPFLADTIEGDGEDQPLSLGAPARSDRQAVRSLTPRQREILGLLIEGKSNKAMARSLRLSEGTVKFHLAAVFRVLGAANRVEAATAGARLLDETAH